MDVLRAEFLHRAAAVAVSGAQLVNTNPSAAKKEITMTDQTQSDHKEDQRSQFMEGSHENTSVKSEEVSRGEVSNNCLNSEPQSIG